MDYAKMKVLVIENEMPTAMMMVSLLTEIGCDAQVATKGKRGMEIAQERKFSLILLATNLPDISGYEICGELKQRHISYRTPIVFLSNQRGDEYRERALELGAADYITKPFESFDFVSRLLSYVKEAEQVSAPD